MKKNDIIELDIVDIGVNAEGIGKALGYTFFVKNAVMGDRVEAVITKMNKGYGFAKMLKVIKPSPYRCIPACDICNQCGGCQIMQISYDAQLQFKENKVRNNLERIGGVKFASSENNDLDAAKFLPIIGMELNGFSQIPNASLSAQANLIKEDTPIHYRNKVQFPVGKNKEGKTITGFYAGRTHYIIETDTCPASLEFNDKILEVVRSFLDENLVSTYSEDTNEGLVRHVLIRNGFATGQTMVCLVINGDSLAGGKNFFKRDNCSSDSKSLEMDNYSNNSNSLERANSLEQKFVSALLSLNDDFMKITSICLNVNKEKTNVILGRKTVSLYGPLYIEDKIKSADPLMNELAFRISPLSFYQVNPYQTAKLYDEALTLAGDLSNATVWDLYCGIGTISLFLAQKAKKVIGVEIVPEAIEDAKENAALNGMNNVEFICGKSEEVFLELVGSLDDDGNVRSADIVVLDPPRKGCDKVLLDKILEVGPERIIYVSCDSATLARDIKILSESYKLVSARPVDMFPNTTHVETVVELRGENVDSYIEVNLETKNLKARPGNATYKEIQD